MVRAQKRTENNMNKLATAIRQLAQAQTRTEKQLERFEKATEERFAGVEERLSRLETALETLTLRVDKLAQAQTRTEKQLERFEKATEKRFSRIETDLAWLKGDSLERRYRELAPAYFGQIVRRAHVLSMDEWVAFLEEAVEQGQISEKEKRELLLSDVIVRGQRRDEEIVYLVVEVSWVIDTEDVKRAYERAGLLSKLKVETVSVVAGREVTRDARQMARSFKVWQVIDGRTLSIA